MAQPLLTFNSVTDGTNTVSVDKLARGACKAHLHFYYDGTATVIFGSYNIGSIQRWAEGYYVINLIVPVDDYTKAIVLANAADYNAGNNLYTNGVRIAHATFHKSPYQIHVQGCYSNQNTRLNHPMHLAVYE